MSQRRCFLCGQKVRPGAGYRLGKLAGIESDKVSEGHLFHNASCANVWMIWKGRHDRWNGIRWSLNRERTRQYGIIMDFAKNFIDSQRQLPDDAMEILDKHLCTLV